MNDTGKFAESISVGYITPLNILINLFVNDGVKSKIYRKNLLHSKYSHIGKPLTPGVAIGPHLKFGFVGVVDFFCSNSQESNIILYDDAYDEKNIPWIEGAMNVKIKAEIIINQGQKIKKFTYTFRMRDGSEVVKELFKRIQLN